MNRRRNAPRRERGQALVETALSMMILLLLLAGMIDFGLAFGYRVTLANASRGGARYGSRYYKMEDLIIEATVDSLRGTLVADSAYVYTPPDPDLAITVACESGGTPIGGGCGNADRGDQIRVTIDCVYHPFFSGILGITDVPISSTTVMYILGQDILGE